ncbi:MAG TPA: metal-dependent transcriptional regulator, partial [Aggregatilineales bacterium]|nr:metal-dependent transcriptional regulator [Aggregatilineales bacterium]
MTETLERGITDKLSERMAELTGHPTRCPHGEPIPSRDGVMPVVIDRPLTEWPVGEPGRVSRVKTHEPEKLIYLRDVNLVPGAPLIVTGRSPFEGPVHLEANGDRLVLGNNLASEIYVEAIEPA